MIRLSCKSLWKHFYSPSNCFSIFIPLHNFWDLQWPKLYVIVSRCDVLKKLPNCTNCYSYKLREIMKTHTRKEYMTRAPWKGTMSRKTLIDVLCGYQRWVKISQSLLFSYKIALYYAWQHYTEHDVHAVVLVGEIWTQIWVNRALDDTDLKFGVLALDSLSRKFPSGPKRLHPLRPPEGGGCPPKHLLSIFLI